jgi:ATP-binding cassette, subfamily B, bacterial
MKKITLVRLLKYMGPILPVFVVSAIMIATIEVVLQLLMAALIKDMFDAIVINELSSLIRVVRNYGIITLLVVGISPLFSYGLGYSVAKTTGNIRKTLFKHLQHLPVSFYKENHSGDLISRLTNDVAQAEGAYYQPLINFAANLIAGVSMIIYLAILDWRLSMVSVALIIIVTIVNVIYAKKLRIVSTQVQTNLGTMTERLSDVLAGGLVIKTFNLYSVMAGKFEKANDDVYNCGVKRVSKNSQLSVINFLVNMGGLFVLLSLASYLSIQGYVTVGVIIASVQIQMSASYMFRSLGGYIDKIQTSLAAADRVFEIIDNPVEQNYEGDHSQEASNCNNAIIFENVDFGYQDDENILKGLSLNVERGSITALVGPSGEGKSTILKLIMGFYDLRGGDISVEGISLSGKGLGYIRDKIAYVPQEAYLFSGTIAENIGFGVDNPSMDNIIKAAQIANAHEFIEKLEHGYDTLVGERGAHLSGGQRQRIAIARAVLKNAPILLLDEATSALDTESEYLVQEALNKLMEGRTTLVIAHRLSTIQNADKILVIKEGSIREEGNHNQLLSTKQGIYRQLYYQQFQTEIKEVTA